MKTHYLKPLLAVLLTLLPCLAGAQDQKISDLTQVGTLSLLDRFELSEDLGGEATWQTRSGNFTQVRTLLVEDAAFAGGWNGDDDAATKNALYDYLVQLDADSNGTIDADELGGLGTNVATFLGTPSSANLAAALTNEAGSGVALFNVLADGNFLDLAAIVHNDTAPQGLRLPQIGASPSNPSSGEGYLGWDQTNNTLEVYNGSSWGPITGGGSQTPWTSDIDADGFGLKFDDLTGIEDAAGNEMLLFDNTTSPTAYFQMATGTSGVTLSALGDATDVGITLSPKGASGVTVNNGLFTPIVFNTSGNLVLGSLNSIFELGTSADSVANRLRIYDGGADNRPGSVTLYTDGGTPYTIFFATDGTLRYVQAASVTDDETDGSEIGGAAGSAVTLDIGDDGGDDSTDLSEIATSGDTNSIFTESAADKLLIDLSNNWPGTDLADTITVADNESTDEENAILFSAGGDIDGGTYAPESDGDFTYNPSTGTVTATAFSLASLSTVTLVFEGILDMGTWEALDDSGTPSVSSGSLFETGGTTTITDFDDGVEGQVIYVQALHSLTFDVTGTDLQGGTTDIVAGDGDMLVWASEDGTTWKLLSFIDASVDVAGGGAETNSLETTITGIADGEIFIGDGADSGTFVAPTGDVTINNAGATTIGAGVVENSMLADDAVDSDELAAGAVDGDHLSADARGIFTEVLSAGHTVSIAASTGEGYGSIHYIDTTATIVLPAVVAGTSFTFIAIGTPTITVDPNASDLIYLDGVALDDGDSIISGGAAGEAVTITYFGATGWHALSDGWSDNG